MAHHGGPGISDAETGGNFIKSDHIFRTFAPGSFAVLAMCAVQAGTMTTPDTTCHPNDGPLAKALEAALAPRTVAEAIAILKSKGVPVAEVVSGDSERFLDDPHATANGMLAIRQHPTAGRMRAAWNFVQFEATQTSFGRHTPILGEHTAEVLAQLGYGAATIAPIIAAASAKV